MATTASTTIANDDQQNEPLQENAEKILTSMDVDSVTKSIPTEFQQKSKAILIYLVQAGVQVELDSFRIIYQGGIIGSALADLLTWTTDSSRSLDRPWD